MLSSNGGPNSRSGPDDPFPLFDGAAVAEQNGACLSAALWEGRQEGDQVQLVGHVCGQLADQGEEFPYFVERVDQEASEHLGTDGMQPVLQRGGDSVVAASTTKGPEQVGILVGTCGEGPAVGGYHVGGNQVVTAEAVTAGQPSNSATEGEAGDAGVEVGSTGRGESEGLGLVVERSPLCPALSPDRFCRRVDADAGHTGKVDHQPVVANAVAREIMASAAHRNQQAVLPSEVDRLDHVGRSAAAGDHGGPLVDHGIPDPSGAVVVLVAGEQRLPVQAAPEVFDCRFADDGVVAGKGSNIQVCHTSALLPAFR